jgi:hypothetical protein
MVESANIVILKDILRGWTRTIQEAELTFRLSDTHRWKEVLTLTTFVQSLKLVSKRRKCARLAATICFIFVFKFLYFWIPETTDGFILSLFYSCISDRVITH